MTRLRGIALVFALIATLSTSTLAQNPPQRAPTPLRLQVVINRFDGEKRLSSMPYTLLLSANERPGVSLRLGSQVAVPNATGYSYMNVGTSIDCSATTTDDGRFRVELRIDDSSFVDQRAPAGRADSAPSLRNFTSTSTVVLRDNQATQFTAATDRITGEVVRVDVVLNVEK